MDVVSKYWRMVRIDAAGKRKVLEIPSMKEFLAKVLPSEVRDSEIQQKLLHLYRDSLEPESIKSELCLRCFLSWIVEQVCYDLEAKFGSNHGFKCSDLLPYVLDDDGKLSQPDSYKSLLVQILQSFDLKQGSLTSWTTMKVKQHPPVSQFLLECGVYLVSDWAILNDTRPKQIERIFKEFFTLTEVEIKQSQCLLQSYHDVYRLQRLQQRAKGIKGKCTPPTNEQLRDISQRIANQTNRVITSENVLSQLQKLASQLREYRIYVRSGYIAEQSLSAQGDGEYNSWIDKIPAPDNNLLADDLQAEFLQFYRQQFNISLRQALVIVTESRVQELQRKKNNKAQQFLLALSLLHCKNLRMGEIAKHLNLRAQDAVTRLLKLKEFRADVRQQMLLMLRDSVTNQAKIYANLEHLKQLDEVITSLLDEQISQVISDAQSQSYTADNDVTKSIFANKLCEYLDSIK